MTTQAIRKAQAKIARWRNDPVAFVREEFGIEPDEWQVEFLHAYNQNQRIAAKACKGPGKTAVLAWCAWHFLATRPHPKIAATSISGDNLADGLWTEMAKWQGKSVFLSEAFVWTKTRIFSRDHPETWWMSARQWSKSADSQRQADTLAGLHADHIMFILDEAGGIPDAVMAAAEAVLANEDAEAKILICGNPTHLEGPLYRACTVEATLWHVIEITGDPDDPKRSKRISIAWARQQIQKYGRDNPWVLVNVFGRFPPSSINALLGPDEVEAAMHRIIRPEVYNRQAKILGVDVALQGDDRTIVAPRQGLAYFKPKELRSAEPKELAGAVAVMARRWQPDAIFVDNTGGWGSGVVSWLTDWGINVTPVQFAGKALDNVYFNKRTEMIHEMAYHIKAGAALPTNNEFKEELCAQTFTHKKNQLLMEDKDIIKEKLGRSPDISDAFALTFAFPVERMNPLEAMQRARTKGDYDPVATEYHPTQQNQVDDYNPLG